LRRLLLAILLIGLVVPAVARDRIKSDEYKGKVYKEIRIDDRGILLIDTLGNEHEVLESGEGGSSGERLPLEEPVSPVPTDADISEGYYTDTIMGINRIGGSVTVSANEYVDGSVVVVGNATIKGHVRGSVTATGRVRISSTGIVDGNVTGSKVTEEPGSQVVGRVSEQRISVPFPEGEWPKGLRSNPAEPLTAGLIWLLLHLAIAVGCANIFEKPTERLRAVFHQNIFKALVVGLLFEIMLPVVFVVLCITIIGIPVALIALPLGIVAAGFLGFAAFCLFISDYIRAKNATSHESRFQQVLVGFAILQVPVIGFFLGLIIDSEAMAIVFGIVSGMLLLIVFTASLGAAILTRFGSRYYGGRVEPGVRIGPDLTAVSEKTEAPEVKSVNARVIMGAGRFRLTKCLTEGVLSAVTGSYNRERLKYDYVFTSQGDRGDFRFATETSGKSLSDLEGRESNWQIEFDGDIDLQLKASVGAAKSEIDAGGLKLSRLDLEIGAADARVDFSAPNKTNLDNFTVEAGACKLQMINIGNSRFRRLQFEGGVGKFVLDFSGQFDYRAEAKVTVGMGALTLIIPRELGLQLRADDNWLSSLGFSKEHLVAVAGSGVYETEGFDAASGQLILTLEIGLGSANIEFR
jgi:cytoskeletal protein CcmA (bactofilin family)